jgi:hypothetical protein
MMGQSGGRKFIVQKLDGGGANGDRWVDVGKAEATDAGAAFDALALRNPAHRIAATTYRVSEEALLVNVSINLEAVDG